MTTRICWVAGLALATSLSFAQSEIVKTIRIQGNHAVSAEAIRAAMRTKEGESYLKATLEGDISAIEQMGFFQKVEVQAPKTGDNGREITIEVLEWPVVKEIRITGNTGIKTEEVMKAVNVEIGKIFNTKTIQPSIEHIRDLYKKKGYFADVSDFRLMADSPQTVSITVLVQTVELVQIAGTKKTDPNLIRRLIRTKPGDPLSKYRWVSDLRRVNSTKWFDDLRTISNDPEPGRTDLTLLVKEADTGSFGVGAQSDGGSLAGTLHIGESNFRGTGQSVGVNFIQGTHGGGPGLDLDYGNPFFDKHNTALNLSLYSHLLYRFAGAGFGSTSTPTNDNLYTERRTGGRLSFGRFLDDSVSASIGLRYEGVKTNNLDDKTASGYIQQDGTLATMTFGLTRNRRDADDDPSRGDWFRVEVEPGLSNITKTGGDLANQAPLGMREYVKTTAEYRTYFSPDKARTIEKPDEARRVFALRARYGAIAGDVPFFEQFFAGGAGSVRGYEDDRFWGKQMALASLEYRHPIQPGMSVIGFVDYGGAWGGFSGVNSFTQSDRPNLHMGYGMGLSFRIPKIGPLRFDYGFDKQGHGRLHFQVATSF